MKNQGWNKLTIKKKLEEIEALLKLEPIKTKKDFLLLTKNILESYLNDSKEEEKYTTLNILQKYQVQRDIYEDFLFAWDIVPEFYKITDSNSKKKLPAPEITSLTKQDLFTLTHDFYKSLDKEYFQVFLKSFNHRNENVRFKKYIGERFIGNGKNIFLPYYNTSLIEIERDYSINDVITMIHEYAHSNSAQINPRFTLNKNNILVELDSLFMELLSYKFLEKKLNDQNVTKAKLLRHDDFVYSANLISHLMLLIAHEKEQKYEFDSIRCLKQHAKKELNYSSNEVYSFINSFDPGDIYYLTCYIYAIELFYKYIDDPEKTMKIFKDIILLNCKKENNFIKQIKRYGLNANEHLEEYHKEFKSDIKILTKKKPKSN